MSESAVSIIKIAQLSIRVTDVERSAAFYNRILGLPLLYSQSNMALLDCNGIRLLLNVAETPQFDHPSSIVYFEVADIEDSHRTLQAQQIEFMGKPHKIAEFGGKAVWMAFFFDPDRNVHALTSEVPL